MAKKKSTQAAKKSSLKKATAKPAAAAPALAKKRGDGLAPAAVRAKLAGYNSIELTTFFSRFGSVKAVKRIIRYAERGILAIEAAESNKERKALEAEKAQLQKRVATVDAKLARFDA